MGPVVHGLEQKYGDQIRFVYLDIDDPATEGFRDAFSYDSRWRPFIMIIDGNGEIILNSSGELSIWIGVVPGKILELGLLNALED